jgi:hypothetical protein
MPVPSAYAEVTVIVDGALDQEITFTDETLMRDFIDKIREDAESDGYPTEVFVLYHEHEPGDCECVQYVTDHRPAYAWNIAAD